MGFKSMSCELKVIQEILSLLLSKFLLATDQFDIVSFTSAMNGNINIYTFHINLHIHIHLHIYILTIIHTYA